MDPHYIQRLRDEVIYLHSLWHQGPPLISREREDDLAEEGGNPRKTNPNNQAPEPMSSPGKEWPFVTPPPAEATSSWGTLAAKPVQLHKSSSPEEQSKFSGRNAQMKALKTVRDFLMGNDDDADSESGSIGSSSDEDDEFMEEDDGRKEYTFFLKVVTEDAELKDYYGKNYAKGEFICFICATVGGKNTGKRFKGCLPLVQHSITVAKTKRRRAHRAFGQAVCKILGWDIDRLSTVVSLLSDSSVGAQVGQNADGKDNSIGIDKMLASEDGNNCEVVLQNATSDSGSLASTDKGIANSTGTDANITLEGLDVVQTSNVEETVTGGLTGVSIWIKFLSLYSSAFWCRIWYCWFRHEFGIVFDISCLLKNCLVDDDVNNTMEGLGAVDLSNEETVAEGLKSIAFMKCGI
ncbi:hypothetical protein F511_40649 [Dorcoceras hygrometricum]|uniref:Uncharacterized protein n=1 Tax=Dorcoceras hygrometricum TaxID=472368 RepID=A0A2Z7C6D1_9LAMI|nr:hypothetical protein F511_40649 [Dorcoceras hygrometricum]